MFHENVEGEKASWKYFKLYGKYAHDADGDTKSSLYNSCKKPKGKVTIKKQDEKRRKEAD